MDRLEMLAAAVAEAKTRAERKKAAKRVERELDRQLMGPLVVDESSQDPPFPGYPNWPLEPL